MRRTAYVGAGRPCTALLGCRLRAPPRPAPAPRPALGFRTPAPAPRPALGFRVGTGVVVVRDINLGGGDDWGVVVRARVVRSIRPVAGLRARALGVLVT